MCQLQKGTRPSSKLETLRKVPHNIILLPRLSEAQHSSNYKTPRATNVETQIPNPFTRLDNDTYLHDRPQGDVFKLLIDSFRIHQADAFNVGGEASPNSVYSGASSSITGFRDFLAHASRRGGMLPSWWDANKTKECEEFGENGDNFSNLKARVDKNAIIKHYTDPRMPMQLRMLAEEICRVPPPGTMPGAGKQMRKVLIAMESGHGMEGPGSNMWMTHFGL
ncbi:hypothetical protein P280DRAFT_405308 [Massarina eburnea CBS 473.64]|uniref:Uncharacterized protein n=1 Tax=Massarina eburnea CBS 473.64 TaxID=1395130 RepID=A0A6A6RSQ7_9PLEO|nr:hypothetical protein P280DRAFT_405308 [Massarina eburnea CBS 473.64]